MAHPNDVKAHAVALLILGERVNHVARRLELPRQTVSRWNTNLEQILDEWFQDEGRYPTLPESGGKMRLNGANNQTEKN